LWHFHYTTDWPEHRLHSPLHLSCGHRVLLTCSTGPPLGGLFRNTIADNAANGDSGQGVYVSRYTTLTFTNTIIAGHSGAGITVTAGSTATLESML
jgi:hypothetical protein